MSDVLKQVEEALEPFAEFAAYIDAHPRSGLGDVLYGWDNADEASLRQSYLRAAAAALTALRGMKWRPIAEMEEGDEFNQSTSLGRWGLWCGQPPERWCLGNCGHMSKSEAIKSGYTHFCRPVLPTPPKREVENAG